ncbi:hypothetical protein HMPREF1199_02495 [Hoylesella oralis CC98A]|nr:hypothetical protein HMPREF1199_02495 [Hoylesella oralis CC98A]
MLGSGGGFLDEGLGMNDEGEPPPSPPKEGCMDEG